MSTFSRWVLTHKLLIVLLWVAVTVVSGLSVSSAVKALSLQITVPGREGFVANQAILRTYGSGGNTPPLVPVITLPRGASATNPRTEAQLAAAFGAVAQALPGSRIVSYPSTHNPAFVSRDGRTTFALIYAGGNQSSFDTPGQAQTEQVLSRYTVDGAHFRLTGVGPLSAGSSDAGVGVLGEVLLGGLGALIVLVFVFRSALAVTPLLMSAAAIPTTFLLIWGLTALTSVTIFIQYLVGILGLGIGIDYSLLLVTRWREERSRGLDNTEAVQRAMETAGVSIIFSGTTVAIGLLALIVLPLPFLRSMGIGGVLIPLVSVAVAITLLPVVLATVGPRLDWPRPRRREESSRFWTAWTRAVISHPWPAAAVALALLGALLAAAATVSLGSPQASSLAKTGEARQGLVALNRSGIGAGVLTPTEVLVRGNERAQVVAALRTIPGVGGVIAPSSWQRSGTAIVDVLPVADGSSSAGRATLDRVRSAAHAVSASSRVGGASAQTADFVSATYGGFPLMILVIVVITYLLLVRAFRSLVLPLKAVLLNVVSVAAAWGIMVLVWQDGFGSKLLWGIPSTGATEAWIPITVFAFLFGISMDYEVFLLTRMREEYDVGRSTDAAVIAGAGRTGRLITSAALILFLAFVSLASAPITDIKVLGTGLGAGVLLDATVVRMLLVPALMKVLGPWNWWLPDSVTRSLRVPVDRPEGFLPEEAAS
ncbi:MAG: MMPL family transporter [Chloroflexi bacterium]|nr:MMPL family transporter [Chloroflexota bacterium]